MTGQRSHGFAVVEALVALLLAAIAITGLTVAAAATVRHIQLARQRSLALGLAADRLEELRAGPRDAGHDEIDVGGTRYTRTWTSDGGRGAPVRLQAEVAWADGHIDLESRAYP